MAVNEQKLRVHSEWNWYDTYVAVIRNSEGSRAYRNNYLLKDGVNIDICQDGNFSCAFFVSSILHNFYLVRGVHATIPSTVADMEDFGWKQDKRFQKGCVVLWEGIRRSDGKVHEHIGFYLDPDTAVSNGPESCIIDIHHPTFGVKGGKPVRGIKAIWTHPRLE